MENILQSQNVFDIIPRQDKSIDLGVGGFKIWVQPCKGYSTLQGAILATQNGVMSIQQSLKDDGPTCATTYDIVNNFVISANIPIKFGIPIVGEKIKITYTNGATPGNVRVGAYLFPVGLYFDVDDLRRKLEPSYDTGQATSADATHLTDSTKNWFDNAWINLFVEITEGLGIGQIRKITANDATTLTIDTAWTINPDASSSYRIGPWGTLFIAGSVDADIKKWGGTDQTGADLTPLFQNLNIPLSNLLLDYGTATGGDIITLIDASKSWQDSIWIGKLVKMISGAAAGNIVKIRVNGDTWIRPDAFLAPIVAGDKYVILEDVRQLLEVPFDSGNSANMPTGLAKQLDDGLVTSATPNTMQCSIKDWEVNIYAGYFVRIVTGAGRNQIRKILSNTFDTLTISQNWAINPALPDRFIIIPALDTPISSLPLDIGTVDTPGVADITDTAKIWTINQWAGYGYRIYAGTGIGNSGRIISNTATTLTVGAIVTDVTSKYIIFPLPLLLVDGKPSVNIGADAVGLAKQILEGIVTADGVGLTVTDGLKDLVADQYIGYGISVLPASGIVFARRIVSHTINGVYTCDAVLPTFIGDKYIIYPLPLMSAGGVQSVTETVPVPIAIGEGTIILIGGGAAEPLTAAPTPCKKIIMISNIGNNAAGIRIGGVGLLATTGVYIAPGDIFTIEINAVEKVYVWGTTGDVIDYTYTS